MTWRRLCPTHEPSNCCTSLAHRHERMVDNSGLELYGDAESSEMSSLGQLAKPLDEDDVHFLLVFQDEVDDLTGATGAEVPATHGAVWVVLVQR